MNLVYTNTSNYTAAGGYGGSASGGPTSQGGAGGHGGDTSIMINMINSQIDDNSRDQDNGDLDVGGIDIEYIVNGSNASRGASGVR